MTEGRGRHFILQGSDGGQRLFWQQIGARTEELSQLNHQHAELDGGVAKRYQYLHQYLDIGLHLIVPTRAGAQHAATLAINDPDGPQQQSGHAKKADGLRKSIDTRLSRLLATHVDVNTFPMLFT